VKRPLGAAAACLVLVALLTACDDEPSERSPTSHRLGVGDTYVALGDSYTAAPRTGPIAVASGCFNTTVNYPHQIADATGMELIDNSCSGANTKMLRIPQRLRFGAEHPPQIEDVDEATDLVTIRLGANDYGLFARIVLCARLFGPDEPGTPCADLDASGAGTDIDTRLGQVADNLERSLADIQRRAPDARIVVVGYPRLTPDEGSCALLPVPAGDYAYVTRIITGLNHALEDAAKTVGATYIDMYAASEGHDICSVEPWVAGLPRDDNGARTPPEGATAWHPYAAEGQAVAQLVLAELER
jgi:hypothetical protein